MLSSILLFTYILIYYSLGSRRLDDLSILGKGRAITRPIMLHCNNFCAILLVNILVIYHLEI